MSKFIALCLFLALTTNSRASELSSILRLIPGEKVPAKQAKEGISKDYSYAIEKNGELLKSASIDFAPPVKPSQYVKPDTKGFCLIQKPKTHAMVFRYFFFDMKTKRRYELTPTKELKGILIQDMPGATEHTPCTFQSFDMGVKKK